MRRTRGFTLIELLISLALAGMIVAGALQLHVSFNRQSQRQQAVIELQQTLRVCMLILERALRTAGNGLPPVMYVDPSCGNVGAIYGFQWSNSNSYAFPITNYWTQTTPDTDPDWFRIVSSDTVGVGGAIFWAGQGSHMQFQANTQQNWQAGDFFVIADPLCPALSPPKVPQFDPVCTRVYQATSAYSGTPNQANGPGDVQRVHGQSCYDPPPGGDTCLGPQSGNSPGNQGGPGNKGCAHPGAPIRHVSANGTIYRIMTPADQGNPSASPKLTMRSAPSGTALIDPNHPWTVLAENIEDMQIAVLLTDGTVCGSATSNNGDDPAKCNYSKVVAVRVTLVGRTAGPLPGAPQSVVGGYEDRPTTFPVPQYDGYVRRALTTTVELRGVSP